jgi:hypothetical protein
MKAKKKSNREKGSNINLKKKENLTVLSFNELILPCFQKFLEQISPRNF